MPAAPTELHRFLQNELARLFDETNLEEAIHEHVDSGREQLVIERIQSVTVI